MTELYDAIYKALNRYPGWEESAVGYALKNSERDRRRIARAVNAAVLKVLEPKEDDA